MSTESTGRSGDVRRGRGHLMANKTGQYGGGLVIESLEELCSLNPMPNLILQLNDLKAMYNLNRVNVTSHHGAADSTNVVAAADATNEATAYTLANAIKVAYEAHRVLTAGSVHGGADGTNTISAANATTTATLVALTEELVLDYTAHIALTAGSVHAGADSTNVLTTANYAGYTCTKAIFPAGSWGLGACTYVKRGMATAVNFDVGTVGALTSYVSNQLDTAALASQHLPSGSAVLPYTSAVAAVLTPDVTPTSTDGLVYLQIHFIRLRALTGSPTT